MASPPRKVLIIDDDPTVRSAIARQVRRQGHQVLLADDGNAGLVVAGQRDPDAIIVDLRMPGIDGHTFVRRLAATGARAGVILLSGSATMDDVIDILRAGACDFLPKPWSLAELAVALERAFEKHDAR